MGGAPLEPKSLDEAEGRVENFRRALGPFVAAVESTRMAMVFTEAHDNRNPLIFVNDSFLELTGFARNEIMGHDLAFLLGNVADTATLSSIEQALVAGTDGTWELQCRRADKSEFLASVFFSPVRDESGRTCQNFLCFVELGGHIDRMLNERNEFHALYELAPGFIAVSQGADHVFTFANASYKRLVGRSNLVGRTVAEALPEIVGQGFIEELDRVFKTGKSFLGTSMPIHLNGSDGSTVLRYITFVYQPVRNATGTITGLFCEGYDVTAERKSADELAVLQAEMIYLSRVNAMGAMAATLAHELNQPLTAISSYVAGCSRLIDANAPNAALLSDNLQATEEASQRAGDIIRHLRELMRRGSPTKTQFDLKVAIDECMRLVRAGGRGDVDMNDISRDALSMLGDRIQIQQVIINFLRNAYEAVETMPVRRVTIGAHETDNEVIVSVTDTGPGVPEQAAKSIFSWTQSTKESGMGLGLSISRTIIEGHGGKIWLERTGNTGSTFCFSVPRMTSHLISTGTLNR